MSEMEEIRLLLIQILDRLSDIEEDVKNAKARQEKMSKNMDHDD